MAEWEIVGIERENPRPGQQGNCLSGLRCSQGLPKLILDSSIVYINANIKEMLAIHKESISGLDTWTDSEGNVVKPRLLVETRSILYGSGLRPEAQG